jgi:hypothetical protein
MKSTCLIFSLILTIFIQPLSAKAMHLLYMADTIDDPIKKATQCDLQNIHSSFACIASACGVQLHSKKLSGSALRQENIEAWMRSALIEKDDVVIVYYSGHGGRSRKSPTIWPFGCFYKKQKADFTFITEKLLNKKAALSMVFLDCCNNFQGKAKNVTSREAFKLGLDNLDLSTVAAGCQQLFFNTNGLIICSGSIPGQVSEILGSDEGSYLTCYFLKRLFTEAQKPNPEWHQIFEKTKTTVMRETKRDPFTKRQNLQYKLFLYEEREHPKVYRKHLYKNCKYEKEKTLDQEESCFCGAYLLGVTILPPTTIFLK